MLAIWEDTGHIGGLPASKDTAGDIGFMTSYIGTTVGRIGMTVNHMGAIASQIGMTAGHIGTTASHM